MVDWPVDAPQEDKQEMTKKISDILEATKKAKAAQLQQLLVPPKLTKAAPEPSSSTKAAPKLLGPAPPPGPPPRKLQKPAPPPGPPPRHMQKPAPPPSPPGAKRRRLSFVVPKGEGFLLVPTDKAMAKGGMIMAAPNPMAKSSMAPRLHATSKAPMAAVKTVKMRGSVTQNPYG